MGSMAAKLREMFPELVYAAYDGAGNVEEYTNGFVRYVDLTLPLHLGVSEWVLSLEVGEHVPSEFEKVRRFKYSLS